MAQFCTNCGNKLDPDAAFCGQCGTSVSEVRDEPIIDVQQNDASYSEK